MARRVDRVPGERVRAAVRSAPAQAVSEPLAQRVGRPGTNLSLQAQVRARQRKLYHAQFATSTLPPAKEETANTGHVTANQSTPALLTMARAPFAVRMLDNLSYGATTTTIAEFNALGTSDSARLANWVDWQLDYTAIDDSAVTNRLNAAGYSTLSKSLPQLWADHALGDPEYSTRMRPGWEVQRASFVRATYSRRQLFEVMVNFWHAHFNTQGTEYSIAPIFAHYDREVIRANAFGSFRTMLESVARSPAMMYFLDNIDNSRSGPNENFARELLELHTFGAENYLGFMDPFQVPPCPEDPSYPIGYTDIDVYETAAAFTGWTIKNGHWQYPNDNDGTFVYRQAWHDAGPKFLLGVMLYPEQPDLKDGRDVMDRLASHPRVAKFICKKIIRRLINDTPPQSLIDSAARVFRDNWRAANQIELVLRHILNSTPMFNAWGQKVRRPFEATVAAMRVLGSDWTLRLDNAKSDEFMWRFGYTGHTPYNWPSPNGYPDVSVSWTGSNSFAMTWKLVNWLTETSDGTTPLAAILAESRSKVANWTANNLVDYWSTRVLGYAPAAERKQALVNFMAQNGNAASDVIADNDTWSANDLKKHYNQQRLRSMVSLLVLSPEFFTR
ncbi:Protein of unknown function [Pseudoxanthomonas sp. GM95]|nr:Protein of unknown function [Pseudoxanthomonas sp. GM95]